MKLRAVIALGAICGCWGAGPTPSGSPDRCESGEGCGDSDGCTGDECAAGCDADVDCAEGQICENEACQQGCRLNADCDDGEACNGAETCDALSCSAGSSEPNTTSCGTDQECWESVCVIVSCGDGRLSPGRGEECDDGQALPTATCLDDCTLPCNLQDPPTCVIDVSSAAVSVQTVAVAQLPQGYVGAKLVVGGGSLDDVVEIVVQSTIDTGDTFQCTNLTATSTEVSCDVDVPHGFTLGGTQLMVNTNDDTLPFPLGLEITKLRVLASGGNDAATGAWDSPIQTLSEGFSRLGPGDTMYLDAGTYVVTQSFPVTGDAATSSNVPAGVTIEGAGVENTVVTGNDTDELPPHKQAFHPAGDFTLRDLTLEHLHWGVYAYQSDTSGARWQISINNVAARDTTWVPFLIREHVDVTLTDANISNTRGHGIELWGNVAFSGTRVQQSVTTGGGTYSVYSWAATEPVVTFTDSNFSGGLTAGIRIASNEVAGTWALNNVVVADSGGWGVEVANVESVTINGGQITGHAADGINFVFDKDGLGGTDPFPRLQIDGTTIQNNGQDGIEVVDRADLSFAALAVDNATISNNGDGYASGAEYGGIAVTEIEGAGPAIELDAGGGGGNNTFTDNDDYTFLRIRASGGVTIYASGNSYTRTLTPNTPSAPDTTTQNPASGQVDQSPWWVIQDGVYLYF